MSIALDSPMEAIAIHGVLTAVNNVWAWIAFLTAAISFWKIKSSIHLSTHHLFLQLSPPPPPPSPPLPKTSPVAAQPDQSELPSTSARSPSSTSKRHTTFCKLENRKSGKFSVYYSQDDKTKGDKIDGEFEEDIDSDRKMSSITRNGEEEVRKMSSVRCNHGEDGWEMLLKIKTAEMGWYVNQDLTVLNGNVVRLWN
ncbi:unnamed protein product [Lactuca virosa]|uniref:Transmembrane protein n=1 Tax=Lactuca virosa TaxID=75947 RepID=A0AAU9MHV4_9ASTR|nr:unnamed protein product [Lactuca virosa]